jgi:hypothetical protein
MDNYKEGFLNNENILVKYSYAFYWAVTTMTTVNFNDNKNKFNLIFNISYVGWIWRHNP